MAAIPDDRREDRSERETWPLSGDPGATSRRKDEAGPGPVTGVPQPAAGGPPPRPATGPGSIISADN